MIYFPFPNALFSHSVHSTSNTLSGNRANPILNSAGKDDKNHSRIFHIDSITRHPDIRLTRGGMILIGLMSGGDYQQGGLARCGVTTAHALARCGFGDSLFEAAMSLGQVDLEEFLANWRTELRNELRTDSKGEIGRKQVALANSITRKFPDIDILLSYVKPITTESMGRASNNVRITWDREPDLAKLAGVCEFYFEWGYKEAIVKRFRTVMWHSIVLRILRRAVLDLDQAKSKTDVPTTPRKGNTLEKMPYGTPSKMIAKHFSSLDINSPTKGSGSEFDKENEEQLIVKVHACRQHPLTDSLPEYRLEIAPKQLVHLTESGVKGLRVPEGPDEWASDDAGDDEDGGKKGKRMPIDPETHLRVWMPACMVKLVRPDLVENYEDLQENKRSKKVAKGNRNALSKQKAPTKKVGGSITQNIQDVFSSPPEKSNAKKATTIARFPLSSFTDETNSESEGKPGFVESTRLVQKQIRQLSPPEDSDEYDVILREELNIRATDAFQVGSNKPPVNDKPRAAIRDLTKRNKQSITTTTKENGLKSFFPVTHASSRITKKSSIQTSRDTDKIVLLSPPKSKTRVDIGAPAESVLSDHIKKSPRQRFEETSRCAGAVSPSPSRPQVKKSMKIIEISSDSDSDRENVVPLQPLLRARARVMTSRNPSTKTSLQLRNEDKPWISSDIIDLT